MPWSIKYAHEIVPWSYHHNILGGLELEELKEDIVTGCDNNNSVLLQRGCELLVEDTGLDLIRDKEEENLPIDASNLTIGLDMNIDSPSATGAAFEKSCSTWNPLAFAS